jgi:competence ComEA-like helix-hairpin-helix protein
MPIKPYFLFSKTEKVAILSVVILIIAVVVLPRIFFVNTQKLQVRQDSILSYLNSQEIRHELAYNKDTLQKTPHRLDLNAATSQELESLPCIGAVMAKRIVNYREKVKKFSTVEDIKKVYGLKDSCYQKILPYVYVALADIKQGKIEEKNTQKLNLNTCDSVQLVQLNGIGAKTAKKILQIRRKIKVFYDIKQLSCLGLQAEIINNLTSQCYVEADAITKIEKISLNQLEEKAVFKSPGFLYEMAKSFVQYRKKLKKQGKAISSWGEVQNNVEGIDKEWLDCWQVYYTF